MISDPTSQEEASMPTYMDMHDIPGVKADDVAGAHEADLKVQGKYGVDYKQYWVNEAEGKVFCLVDAPSKGAAARPHREAHGLEAPTLYEAKRGGYPRRSSRRCRSTPRRSFGAATGS